MSTLSFFLPPFASDYVGAASALFELDCLVAINDGSCCTSHYASYDEPRWNTGRKQTLCTNLRMDDTVFGIDERIISQLGEAAIDLKAKRIIALGTPVPAVIGTDMTGLAMELEQATGIPSFGIDTTGFETYVKGIDKAFELILGQSEPSSPSETCKPFVNVLGMTPIDFNVDGAKALRELLSHEGITVGCQLFMGANEDALQDIPQATCNIAVSYSGILAARKLQQKFGTPYVACSFTSSKETREALLRIKSSIEGSTLESEVPQEASSDVRILVIGDQVIANSIRSALREAEPCASAHIIVASFFGLVPSHAEPHDLHLSDETALIKHLKSNPYDVVVGDPLLQRIPPLADCAFVGVAHPAISSRLFRDQAPCPGRFDFDQLARGVNLALT